MLLFSSSAAYWNLNSAYGVMTAICRRYLHARMHLPLPGALLAQPANITACLLIESQPEELQPGLQAHVHKQAQAQALGQALPVVISAVQVEGCCQGTFMKRLVEGYLRTFMKRLVEGYLRTFMKRRVEGYLRTLDL